jgi:uncharacterized repeat protein (TIGR01451 family)
MRKVVAWAAAIGIGLAVSLAPGTAGAAGVPTQLLFDHGGTACRSVSGHNLSTSPKMSQTGIALVNGQLLLSCWGDTTITAIDPHSGSEITVYHISAGSYKAFGAMAYDRFTSTLYACASTTNAGSGFPENAMSEVGVINLSTATFTPVFPAPGGCDNGLAWDPGTTPGRTDTLWTSGDTATTLVDYSTSGTQLESDTVASLLGATPANSGIAIGGGKFYLANPQTATKRVYSLTADLDHWADPTEPLLSSTHRYEDLECDDQTYAPQTVIWVMWFNQNVLKPLPIAGTCAGPPPPPPELGVVQSSGSPVTAGQTLDFTDTVHNAGPGTETTVSLSQTMPSNAAFLSATPSAGSCTSGPTLTCSLGTLLPGATVTVDVAFTTFGPGMVESPVRVSSDETPQVSDDEPATVNPAAGVTYVTVGDSAIAPTSPQPALGGSVRFLIQGTAAHSIADNSGLGLFSSGSLTPPAAFDYNFPASGAYKIVDGTTGHTATVQVATGNPPTAPVNLPFTVSWATQALPAGTVEDVQVMAPGAGWVMFQHGTIALNAPYMPPKAGTYKFRARLRNTATGKTTAYGTGNTTQVS